MRDSLALFLSASASAQSIHCLPTAPSNRTGLAPAAVRDVTIITKARTALVVPNAIEVVMVDGRRDFFTSFVSHDKARSGQPRCRPHLPPSAATELGAVPARHPPVAVEHTHRLCGGQKGIVT